MPNLLDIPADVREDLLPVRMLNEYAYCPRLFHLMHVEGRWEDNVYTLEGKHVHRRVDRLDQVLPEAVGDDTVKDGPAEGEQLPLDTPGVGDEPPEVARSVPLGSELLGITAKLDLVAVDDRANPPEAVPVETKRGRVPQNEERSWEPERVQLMAQGLLLREHGYACDHGVLYFAGSRVRVDVPFTPELEARTRELITLARQATKVRDLPPPLEDSPKCAGCSLCGICLPDETLALRTAPEDPEKPGIRRLYPARDDALPFYVQEQGAQVGKKGDNLVVRKGGKQLGASHIKDTSQLVICGNVQLTTQALHQLCEAAIPIVYLSTGNWFYGVTHGIHLRNAFDRAAQFEVARSHPRRLAFARQLVADKGMNQRTMLRRNGHAPDTALRDMAKLIEQARTAPALATLLGLEGNLARHYFAHFNTLLNPRDLSTEWDFKNRNRRPPRDPVNAMLSFAYALLTKECTVALLSEGLEPHWGLYHQPRHGRPALALDIMEPLRPLIADSAVITAVNTGMVRAKDFTIGAGACLLEAGGRKALIRAFEARLDHLVTHPVFDYRCSWRAAIRLHARLLARWFRGDVPEYVSITTR